MTEERSFEEKVDEFMLATEAARLADERLIAFLREYLDEGESNE